MAEYRQVRVLIYPGRRSVVYAVVARVVSARGAVDRVLSRGDLGHPSEYASTGALLLAVSDLLALEAERI